MSSARDAAVVARLQLSRALRTRSAIALCAVYALLAGASAYGFTRLLGLLEEQAARALQVPVTQTPGAMWDRLREQQELRDLFTGLLGDASLLSWALDQPYLSITSFWTGLAVLPFFAAMVGAEAVAPDVRDRCLRFELLRTGRLEVMLGRLGGMALLLSVALLCGTLAIWAVAMVAMVGNGPAEQLTSLLALAPRLWLWTLPFLGLGVAASQLTTNVNQARVLALGAVTASWVGYLRLEWLHELDPQLWMSLLQPLAPQSWLQGLWGPGLGWATPGLVLAAMGLLMACAGLPVFLRRNL